MICSHPFASMSFNMRYNLWTNGRRICTTESVFTSLVSASLYDDAMNSSPLFLWMKSRPFCSVIELAVTLICCYWFGFGSECTVLLSYTSWAWLTSLPKKCQAFLTSRSNANWKIPHCVYILFFTYTTQTPEFLRGKRTVTDRATNFFFVDHIPEQKSAVHATSTLCSPPSGTRISIS